MNWIYFWITVIAAIFAYSILSPIVADWAARREMRKRREIAQLAKRMDGPDRRWMWWEE